MWAEAVRETARMMVGEPYSGFEGKYFSMKSRNVVPKPVQKPHPPLWVACTNRDTLRLAARLGLGALTFSFMDAGEARYWVDDYYTTFKNECTPIGQTVNPNVAMLAGVLVHEDGRVAEQRGLEGQQFFKWALAYYYRFGSHQPGRSSLWEQFQRAEREPMAGVEAVGDVERARRHFQQLEEAGVDQVILLQQAGNYEHQHVCDSLELLGRRVIPEFRARHGQRALEKQRELAPYVARALANVPALESHPPEVVEAYPVLWGKGGVTSQDAGTKRALDAAGLWRLHVGGAAAASSRG
jgi:alkanesulfonate monooxygenase SsuD/methylene tetrahydromethanopterin reductase-like flavin-dependent oxidoreductase (luciferase family)